MSKQRNKNDTRPYDNNDRSLHGLSNIFADGKGELYE